MHVITRHIDEGLVVGDDVHVTVLDIAEDRVRLAVSCPHSQPSYWEETLYWQPETEPQELQLQ